MVEGEVALHDVAALKPILEEAGGVFLTRHDAPLVTGFREGTLSANRNVAEGLRELLGF
jgi:fructose-1,6-bisphosphatase/inositol monophosphatase family enzyme